MPQLFNVLRCYKCLVFQVHQTKKSNKWECKVCGEKQSVKRFYALGTAKECRFHVQKLNGIRGEVDGQKSNTTQDSDSSQDDETLTDPTKDNYTHVQDSKWSHYVETTEPVEENTIEKMTLDGAEVVLEVPKKRRKLNNNIAKRTPKVSPAGNRKIDESSQNYPEHLKNHFDLADIAPNTASLSLYPAGSIQSNTPKPCSYVENITPEEQLMNRKHKNFKQFVAPVKNANSKWAQFTEEPDATKQHADKSALSQSFNNGTHDLFSWSNEKDLDLILDI